MIIAIILLALTSLSLPRLRLVQGYLGFSACIILGSIIGLRSFKSGTDTLTYVNYFNSIQGSPAEFEPLFYYYTLAISYLTNETGYIFSLSAIPLLLIYVSAVLAKVDRPTLLLCLFVAFTPGIDLITNGLRQGLALTCALTVLAITASRRTSYYFLHVIPIFLHFSAIIVAISEICARRISLKKINALNITGCALFIFWFVFSADLIIDIITPYLGTAFPIFEKLLRYLVNQDSILSLPVYLYFIFLSVLLTLVNMFFVNQKKADSDTVERLFYATSSVLFLGFAAVSFSAFAYRFMFIGYVFQIFLCGILLDRRRSETASFLYVFIILVSSVVTYTTKTMANATFLDIV